MESTQKVNHFENDLIGNRQEYAEIIEKLIANSNRSIQDDNAQVLGIDGRWGTGKTTFINMLTPYLQDKGYTVIKFNAWESDHTGDPLLALVAEISAQMQKPVDSDNSLDKSGITEKSNGIKQGALKVARGVGKGLLKYTLGKAPAATEIVDATKGEFASSASSSYEENKEDFFAEYQGRKEAIRDIRKSFNELAELLSPSSEPAKPLVVIIDELDRCRPNYALEVLEMVKHIFGIPTVFFMLAVDRAQLENSIKHIYGSEMDVHGYLARFINPCLKLDGIPADQDNLFYCNILKRYGIDFNGIDGTGRLFTMFFRLFPEATLREMHSAIEFYSILRKLNTGFDNMIWLAKGYTIFLIILQLCSRYDYDKFIISTNKAEFLVKNVFDKRIQSDHIANRKVNKYMIIGIVFFNLSEQYRTFKNDGDLFQNLCSDKISEILSQKFYNSIELTKLKSDFDKMPNEDLPEIYEYMNLNSTIISRVELLSRFDT